MRKNIDLIIEGLTQDRIEESKVITLADTTFNSPLGKVKFEKTFVKGTNRVRANYHYVGTFLDSGLKFSYSDVPQFSGQSRITFVNGMTLQDSVFKDMLDKVNIYYGDKSSTILRQFAQDSVNKIKPLLQSCRDFFYDTEEVEATNESVVNEAKKMADQSYYKYLKGEIKNIVGIPVTALDSTSTRSQYWIDGDVTVEVIGYKDKNCEISKKILSATKDIESKLPGAEVKQKVYSDKFITAYVTIPLDKLETLMGGTPTQNKEDGPVISYWVTSVFDTRNGHYAYGAKITDDDFKFPGSIKNIQKRLGEKYFSMYYSAGTSKNFRSYGELVKFLKKEGANPPSEEDIINAGYEERYYTF